MMEKFKLCPNCGKRNATDAMDCAACGWDISFVRLTDEVTAQQDTAVRAAEQAARPGTKARICDSCGHRNPANARKCAACGEDLSGILPAEAAEAEETHYILASLDGEYAYEIRPGATVIGKRGAMAEYLAGRDFVSREQARITLENGRVTIVNCNQWNGTFVNNRRLGYNEAAELQDGDEIGLGGDEKNGQRQEGAAYFRMRIGTCI